ncbi:30S ribosomal protein S20 [Ectothiorhodospiraceae bacterium BW-2]|nr:30S ribosomal protein S20 [Ectothiorhodospiraceae bacterium BW-2]
MANSAQARKRARQADKRRIHNASERSALRTAMKKVVKSADSGDKEAASAAYQSAVPVIDRAIKKGLLHKNSAARTKSRLNKRIRALG